MPKIGKIVRAVIPKNGALNLIIKNGGIIKPFPYGDSKIWTMYKIRNKMMISVKFGHFFPFFF